MKLLFLAGREPAYVRNAIVLKCLERNKVEIVDCSDSSATYPARFVKTLLKFLTRKNFDCVFVGFLGQPLVPLVGMLTRKPIIFDAFLSMFDTLCFDRKKFPPDSLLGRSLYWLDKYSCERSDCIILDTFAHIDYFVKTFGLPREQFRRVLVGADETIFHPRQVKRDERKFKVFYYSSFLPLHGCEHIVQAAARLLKEKEIEFTMVGKGPEHERVLSLARELAVDNVRFIDWLPYQQLPSEIAQADVCLGGHFSDVDKAKRVIAGKTFQFIAMKKAVIVGDCPGNRELFIDGKNASFVKMADADSLADAVLALRDDVASRERIAEEGYKTFTEHCTIEAIGNKLIDAISEGMSKS